MSKKGFYCTEIDKSSLSKGSVAVAKTNTYQPVSTGIGSIFLRRFLFFLSIFCASLVTTLILEFFSNDWSSIVGLKGGLDFSIADQENLFQEELKNLRDLHANNPELLEKEFASCREKHNSRLLYLYQTFHKIIKG